MPLNFYNASIKFFAKQLFHIKLLHSIKADTAEGTAEYCTAIDDDVVVFLIYSAVAGFVDKGGGGVTCDDIFILKIYLIVFRFAYYIFEKGTALGGEHSLFLGNGMGEEEFALAYLNLLKIKEGCNIGKDLLFVGNVKASEFVVCGHTAVSKPHFAYICNIIGDLFAVYCWL